MLLVLYLVFNEGYYATSRQLIRRDLCDEAIRLARVVCELMPEQMEARALLALMLLHDSRRDARLVRPQDFACWINSRRAKNLQVITFTRQPALTFCAVFGFGRMPERLIGERCLSSRTRRSADSSRGGWQRLSRRLVEAVR